VDLNVAPEIVGAGEDAGVQDARPASRPVGTSAGGGSPATGETGGGRVVTLVGFDPRLEFLVATALKDRGDTVGGEAVGWGTVEDTVLELAAARPDAVVLGPALGPAAEPLLRALWAAPETRHLPLVVVDDAPPPAIAGAPNVRARPAPPFDVAAVVEVLSPALASPTPAWPRRRGGPPRPSDRARPRPIGTRCRPPDTTRRAWTSGRCARAEPAPGGLGHDAPVGRRVAGADPR
jgi:hypothetical protein